MPKAGINRLKLTQVEVVVLRVTDGNQEDDGVDDGCGEMVSMRSSYPGRYFFCQTCREITAFRSV